MTAVNALARFRTAHRMPQPWPVPVDHVALFISHCFESGRASSTIATYIHGLNYFHRLNSWYDITGTFVISKLLEGCRRSRASKDSRSPVTPGMLVAMCRVLPVVCYNQYETTLFRAAFTLAYFGLFRVSEMVCPSRTACGHAILVGDVSVGKDASSVSIILRTQKSRPCGPPAVIKIGREVESATCPVQALQLF